MSKAYIEKLRDPRWQKKRLEVLNRDNWTCQDCSSTEKTLHVHHKVYFPNTEPWEYDPMHLITLCHECHELESQTLDRAIAVMAETMKGVGFMAADFEMIEIPLRKYIEQFTNQQKSDFLEGFNCLVQDYKSNG